MDFYVATYSMHYDIGNYKMQYAIWNSKIYLIPSRRSNLNEKESNFLRTFKFNDKNDECVEKKNLNLVFERINSRYDFRGWK